MEQPAHHLTFHPQQRMPDVFERLSRPSLKPDRHLEEAIHQHLATQEEEEREMQDRPVINSRSQQLAPGSYSEIHNRLYENAIQRQHQQDQIEQLVIERQHHMMQLDQMRIHHTLPDEAVQEEFVLRQREHQENKVHLLQQLRLIQEQSSQADFTPQLNRRSQQIACQAKQDYTQPTTHLRLLENRPSERILNTLQKYEHIYSQQHPFRPHTNPGPEPNKPFLCRQEDHLTSKKDHLARTKSSLEAGLTFHPSINEFSDLLAKTADKGRAERKKEEKKREARREADKDLTFQPAINEFSQALTKHHFLEDHSAKQQARLEQNRRSLQTQQLHRDMKECSFKPKVNHNPKYSATKNIYPLQSSHKVFPGEQRKKTRLLEEQQRQKEEQEMKECTFKPKVKKYKRQEETVLIQGLDNFLAGRERKARQEEELKRERADLGTKYHALRHVVPTVPRPFQLS